MPYWHFCAIAEVEKRARDEGYKTRLGGYPVPRLWDMYQSATKRIAGKEKAAKLAEKKKPAAAPKKKAAAPKKKAAAKKA